MHSATNRVGLSALLCLCAACGDSAPSLDADGIEHVQRINVRSSTAGEGFGGGPRQVDSYPMVAQDSTLVVRKEYSRTAYDFNVGEQLVEEGSLIVFRRVGEQWRESDVLPAPPTTRNGGPRLGIHQPSQEIGSLRRTEVRSSFSRKRGIVGFWRRSSKATSA